MEYYLHKPPQQLDSSLLPKLKGDALEWHRQLKGYRETPLYHLSGLSAGLPLGEVFVKDEGHRFGQRSFKTLGASWAMHRILQQNRMPRVFCSATDGNHGAALAWAARMMGQSVKIFLPKGTVDDRVEFIRSLNADAEVTDKDYDGTVCHAARFAEATGSVLVQDTAWDAYEDIPLMIAEGYTTVIKEVQKQWSDTLLPQLAILQVGVGTWAMAAATELKSWNPEMKILCVEPREADGLQESFRQNSLSTTAKSQKTLMAGLNCGTPSVHAFPVLHQLMDAVVSLEDQWAVKAMKQFYDPQHPDPQIESGESGAAGLGALLALQESRELQNHLQLRHDSRILLFNTESITNRSLFDTLIRNNPSD